MVLLNDKKSGSLKLSQPIKTRASPNKPLTSHLKGRIKNLNPLISTDQESYQQHASVAGADTERFSQKMQSQPSDDKAALVTFQDENEKITDSIYKEPEIPEKTENYQQASNRAQQRMQINTGETALACESMRSGGNQSNNRRDQLMMTGVMSATHDSRASQSMDPGFRVYGKNQAQGYNILHTFKMKGGKQAIRKPQFRGRRTLESPQ